MQDYLVTGEVSAIRENGATSGIGVLGTYAYDDLGRMTSLTRGNGAVTSYVYDQVSRMSSLSHDLAGTTNDLTTAFTYNPASQITSNTRNNDIYAWNGHYNVDRPYSVNGLNQLTTAGATALGYDGRGNLTSSGATTYGYTSENRLATGSGPTAVSNAYDPLGRLSAIDTTTTTNFDYAGSAAITELDWPAYNIKRRYVFGPGDDAPLVWYEGAGTTSRRWLIPDERGSIIAVTDATGAATSVNRYDEYGIPASTNVGRFQYTGQAWLSEIGLYYYKARIYSPTLGRFMQTDPIGYSAGINWYDYVGGDPVNRSDPSGESCTTPTGSLICKVDQIVLPKGQINMTPQQARDVKRFERNYTKAEQRIATNNRTVQVGATGGRKGTSFTTTGKEIASSLASRTLIYRAGQKSGNALMTTGGNPVTQKIFTNVYESEMKQSDAEQQSDIAHEGIHSSISELKGNALSPVLGYPPYAAEHQEPYNQAADRLLTPR
jgi:RHS repeat-associated protein